MPERIVEGFEAGALSSTPICSIRRPPRRRADTLAGLAPRRTSVCFRLSTYDGSDLSYENRQMTDFRRASARPTLASCFAKQEMTMIKRSKTSKGAVPFAAGVLIGLSIVTPVFGATLDVETWQPLLLLGSLVILLIGLIMKATSTARPSSPAMERDSQALAPDDLRWSDTGPATDVALPRLNRAQAH